MHLPDGYVAETHWSWSQVNPSVWSQEMSSCEWEHLDDTYLFPMSPPKSFPCSWSRRGSIVESSSSERPCARSAAHVDSHRQSKGKSANNFSGENEERARSSTSASVQIRGSTNARARLFPREAPQSARWRSIDAPDADPDMSWEARQRYERRFALTETRVESECQSSRDEKDCHCTECTSRRWRRER